MRLNRAPLGLFMGKRNNLLNRAIENANVPAWLKRGVELCAARLISILVRGVLPGETIWGQLGLMLQDEIFKFCPERNYSVAAPCMTRDHKMCFLVLLVATALPLVRSFSPLFPVTDQLGFVS